jgi:hypothetical protein
MNYVEIKGFRHITHTNDGQEVWFASGLDLVRCKVAAAMGRTARIVNHNRGIDTWADVDELFVRER